MDTIANSTRVRTPAEKIGFLSNPEKRFVVILATAMTNDEIKRTCGLFSKKYREQLYELVIFLGARCEPTEQSMRDVVKKAYLESGLTFAEEPASPPLIAHQAAAQPLLLPAPVAPSDAIDLASKTFKIVFVKNVKALARARGMRIGALGKCVGKSDSYIGNLSDGYGELSKTTFDAFAVLLGVCPKVLTSQKPLTETQVTEALTPPLDGSAPQHGVMREHKSGKSRERCIFKGVDLNSKEFKDVFSKNAILIAKELGISITRVGADVAASNAFLHGMVGGGGMTLNRARLAKTAERLGVSEAFLMTSKVLTANQIERQVEKARSSHLAKKFLTHFIKTKAAGKTVALPEIDVQALSNLAASKGAVEFVSRYHALKECMLLFSGWKERRLAMAMLHKESFGKASAKT